MFSMWKIDSNERHVQACPTGTWYWWKSRVRSMWQGVKLNCNAQVSCTVGSWSTSAATVWHLQRMVSWLLKKSLFFYLEIDLAYIFTQKSIFRYKNRENLRSHMKSIHIEGPQTCTICGRISTNMKALAKHKKIHTAGSKERFKCIVCGKGFRDRTKLKVKYNAKYDFRVSFL